MANWTFPTDAMGWIGNGLDGGGGCPQPIMYWDGTSGYPALGCLRIDLCDMTGGAGNTAPYFDLASLQRTGLSISITSGLEYTFWFQIQNRSASQRTFRVEVGSDASITAPGYTDYLVNGNTSTPWTKFTSTFSAISTVNDLYISVDPIDLATSSDGYYSILIDNVYIDEVDPTPPPVIVTDYQPSTGGIPWLIKEDF